MKTCSKIAVLLALIIVALSWVATPYIAETKIRAQISADAEKQRKTNSTLKVDILVVDILHTYAPFLFKARTLIKRVVETDTTIKESRSDEIASYFYTPWRAYKLQVAAFSYYKEQN